MPRELVGTVPVHEVPHINVTIQLSDEEHSWYSKRGNKSQPVHVCLKNCAIYLQQQYMDLVMKNTPGIAREVTQPGLVGR